MAELSEQLTNETQLKTQEIAKLKEEVKTALTKALTQGQELTKVLTSSTSSS